MVPYASPKNKVAMSAGLKTIEQHSRSSSSSELSVNDEGISKVKEKSQNI
jgi:hypothetical protein